MMGGEELAQVAALAARFAQEQVAPLVGVEGRDGDLTALSDLLAQADELGLLASPQPNAPGHDYGVWGRACLDDGPAASLAMLEQLGRACAGVAACIHFAGLGAFELGVAFEPGGASDSPACRVAVACSRLKWPETDELVGGMFGQPGSEPLVLSAEGRLSGSCAFVHAAPATDVLLVCCDEPADLRVVIKADAAGAQRSELGQTTGLAACSVFSLQLDDVAVPSAQQLSPCSLEGYHTRLWLGLCAIAVGNAQGALQAAREYAGERYQGGQLIERHATVQLLLGAAESAIATSRACVLHHAQQASWPSRRQTAMLKVRVVADCAKAVSDCLQVFGGYGYMEDYRLEKRLRDALTLKSMCGRNDELLMRIATSSKEVA